MADDAVLDATLDSVDETADLTADSTATDDSTADGSVDDSAVSGETLSGSPLWKSIKESLSTVDKKTAEQVRRAIYNDSEVGKRHPEGLKGIDAVLESVKRLSDDTETPDAVPIEQVIEDTLGERSFWREFDGEFQAGDPKIIGKMVEANPEAFQKLVPEALNKFAELNPDGYSSIIAKAADTYFRDMEIPLHLKLLDRIIPQSSDDPAVQQLIEGYAVIKKAFEGLSAMASKPLAAPEVKKTDATPQNQPAQEDASLRLRDIEWNATIAPTSQSLMVTEAQKVLGSTKLTADEIGKVRAKFKEEINARVSINQPYQNALKAYLKANNKAAYLQRVNSEHQKIIKGAAARIVGDALQARKTAPKPAATAVQKPALAAEAGAIKFERIAGPPQTQNLKVDLARTPQHMLVKRQAYIVGRKNPVQWGPK